MLMFHQGQESITKVEENGDVVMVMERRTLSDGREGQFVLRVRHSNSFFFCSAYSVSQKIPPKVFCHFFPNGWEFFVQILHACYSFLSTLDYRVLFNYLHFFEVIPH